MTWYAVGGSDHDRCDVCGAAAEWARLETVDRLYDTKRERLLPGPISEVVRLKRCVPHAPAASGKAGRCNHAQSATPTCKK